MSSCIHVVEGVEDQGEAGEPFEIELLIFDVGMMGNEFDVGVELLGDILCDDGFGLLDMFLPEEKLTIKIGKIDCVKVDDVNLAKTSED